MPITRSKMPLFLEKLTSKLRFAIKRDDVRKRFLLFYKIKEM